MLEQPHDGEQSFHLLRGEEMAADIEVESAPSEAWGNCDVQRLQLDSCIGPFLATRDELAQRLHGVEKALGARCLHIIALSVMREV